MAKKLKVKATLQGYYGEARIDPGKEFALESESHFSHNWMQAIDWEPPQPRSGSVGSKKAEAKGKDAPSPAAKQVTPDKAPVKS